MRACGSVRLDFEARANLPTFTGVGQFAGSRLALGKETRSPPLQQRIRAGEEVGKGSKRPRRHHLEAFRGVINKILDPGGVDHRRSPGCPSRFAQEGRLLGVAFDEVDLGPLGIGKCASDHQAGEATAGAEVDPSACLWRQCEELQRIGDMARPRFRFGRGSDQVDAPLPIEEERDEAVEARRCFT